MSVFILYSTESCHLCEQAQALLVPVLNHVNAMAQTPVRLQVQDIADSEALVARYGVRIPVLCYAAGGQELAWPFDQAQAFAFIQSCTRI
ncbi:MAG: glutaredoxin family protein [Pseudomonadales bacterium]|nr:glutaredoxin family protein [Pseudomonadales bacterium]MCP5331625.1 glutaredoxin family protein [Pseudomonadales bacterium]MCP5344744.1 glutaredoxin family protein [Pseudomonadales bacterium]